MLALVTLADTVKQDLTSAMKAGESDRVAALRLVLSELQKAAKDGDGDVPGWHRYATDLDFDRSGNFGYTVRVVPSHPDLLTPAFLDRVAWAPSPSGPPGSDYD